MLDTLGDKCEVEGNYDQNRMSFPDMKCRLRSDSNFRKKTNPEHHLGTSILQELPGLDMIKHFPCEYMHLVTLGVVKKLIHIWVDGKPGPHKLASSKIKDLSKLIVLKSSEVVSEFSRKPRGLSDLARWKATEFRQFLMYLGPVVLKNIVSDDDYKLFMCLFVSISLLSGESTHLTFNDYASQLLLFFVRNFGILYGKHQISYNVHALTHVALDCKNLGPVDKYSAFKFENYLFQIKKLVRTPNKPLIQVLHGLERKRVYRKNNSPIFPFSRSHRSGPHLVGFNGQEYKCAKINLCTIRTDRVADSYILTKIFSLCQVKNICFNPADSEYVFFVVETSEKENLFCETCDSVVLRIYKFQHFSENSDLKVIKLSDILCKCQVFSEDKYLISFPLLHSSS